MAFTAAALAAFVLSPTSKGAWQVPAKRMPGDGQLHRPQLGVHLQQEAVRAHGQLHHLHQIGHIIGLHAGGQHHQVHRGLDLLAPGEHILALHRQGVLAALGAEAHLGGPLSASKRTNTTPLREACS